MARPEIVFKTQKVESANKKKSGSLEQERVNFNEETFSRRVIFSRGVQKALFPSYKSDSS